MLSPIFILERTSFCLGVFRSTSILNMFSFWGCPEDVHSFPRNSNLVFCCPVLQTDGFIILLFSVLHVEFDEDGPGQCRRWQHYPVHPHPAPPPQPWFLIAVRGVCVSITACWFISRFPIWLGSFDPPSLTSLSSSLTSRLPSGQCQQVQCMDLPPTLQVLVTLPVQLTRK